MLLISLKSRLLGITSNTELYSLTKLPGIVGNDCFCGRSAAREGNAGGGKGWGCERLEVATRYHPYFDQIIFMFASVRKQSIGRFYVCFSGLMIFFLFSTVHAKSEFIFSLNHTRF